MFQILEFTVPAGEKIVIDDKLKTQYKAVSGMTIWTPDHNKLRLINIELKVDSKEVLPQGFPSEIFSVNPFRNVDDCTLKLNFPELSKFEGNIYNGNGESVTLKLIFFIKL